MLLGHTKQINGVWKIQSLKQHSENVAEYCARACQPLGLENLGRLTGWLHDAGKSHSNVQKHLRGQTNERINHSSAGMRWLWENYGGETASPPSRLTAQMAALAIGSHHSERMDVFDLGGVEPWIKHMYSEQAQELYEESCRAFFADCISETEIRQMFAKAAQEVECLVRKIRTQEGKKPRLCIYQVMLGLAHRFLFAALIDADWLDSGNYYNQEGCLPPEQLPPWDLIESNVERFLNNLQPRHKIDTLRAEISEQCKTAGECAKQGIYRLYVPTGGGKTFSGLRYCVHALLSFAYSMLARECASALTAVGLDPYVGFMHRPRPGRKSLALDLMEELRAVYADRLVISCINQKIITAKHLQKQENGAVLLTDDGRKAFLTAWQNKKKEEITHPFLKEKLPWGLVPYVQALLLARALRGDLEVYPPFFWK